MPCHAAMIDKPVTVSADEEIEKALKKLKKAKAETAAVIDKNGALEGVFSISGLFQNVLPVHVSVEGSTSASMQIGGAPGIAKRLHKVMALPVSEVMNRKPKIVYPETPTWEGIKLLMQDSDPVMVIEQETQKFLGMMKCRSALDELTRLQEGS